MAGEKAGPEQDKIWVRQLVESAQARKFFGKIVLTFVNGEVKHAEKQESLKPPSGG